MRVFSFASASSEVSSQKKKKKSAAFVVLDNHGIRLFFAVLFDLAEFAPRKNRIVARAL